MAPHKYYELEMLLAHPGVSWQTIDSFHNYGEGTIHGVTDYIFGKSL